MSTQKNDQTEKPMNEQAPESGKGKKKPAAPKIEESKNEAPADAPADEKPLDEKLTDFKGDINDHHVTQEDIADNPELQEAGVKAGDVIDFDKPEEQIEEKPVEDIPAETTEQEKPEETHADTELPPPGDAHVQEEKPFDGTALLTDEADAPADETTAAETEVVNGITVDKSEAKKEAILAKRKERLEQRNDPNFVHPFTQRKKF